MRRDVEVAVVRSPRGWEQPLTAYAQDHGGLRIRLASTDPVRLRREHYAVLVIDDTASFLDAEFVAVLRETGRDLVGVYDADGDGKQTLTDLGVTALVEETAPPEEFVAAIQSLARALPTLTGIADERGPQAGGESQTRRAGHVTAVAGPAGGPGATEVAIALASAAARRGERVVLVDGDDVAPNMAQRLGLDLYPNIRLAIDAIEQRTGRLTDALVRAPGGGFAVLAGLSARTDWAELRPAQANAVIAALAAQPATQVLVNVGHRLEHLPAGVGPARYGTARALLAAADALVGVGAGTPLAIARLLEWITEARALADGRPIHLVVNHAPDQAYARTQIAHEIARTYTPASLSFVPADRRVTAAVWNGRCVPSGPFTRSIDAAADAILPRLATMAAKSRRWRR